eukprot:3730162-Pleurochrysis_carterae.AAC.1
MRRVQHEYLSCADWASRAVDRRALCASGSPCANGCLCTTGTVPTSCSIFRSARGEVVSGPWVCFGSHRRVQRRHAMRLGLPRVRA